MYILHLSLVGSVNWQLTVDKPIQHRFKGPVSAAVKYSVFRHFVVFCCGGSFIGVVVWRWMLMYAHIVLIQVSRMP